MSEQFTPAPWSLLPQNRAGPMVVQEFETGEQMNPTGYRLICHMLQRGDSLKEDRANARLISAAPDMFAALREARAMLRSCSLEEPDEEMQATWDKGLAAVDAALAKASPPTLNALSAKIEQEHVE